MDLTAAGHACQPAFFGRGSRASWPAERRQGRSWRGGDAAYAHRVQDRLARDALDCYNSGMQAAGRRGEDEAAAQAGETVPSVASRATFCQAFTTGS
jgi:hypothetical protein